MDLEREKEYCSTSETGQKMVHWVFEIELLQILQEFGEMQQKQSIIIFFHDYIGKD